jgi:hypothetical protein
MIRHREKRMHWLSKMINKYHFQIGVEVGAATGLTTSHILENCKSLKKLYVADDWRPVVNPGHPSYYPGHPWSKNDMEQVFWEKVKNNEKIVALRGITWESADAVEDRSLDFAFIDASHDYQSVMNDLNAWTPKVKKGGLMCGHDINITDGVLKAVTEKFGSFQNTKIDHVWAVNI